MIPDANCVYIPVAEMPDWIASFRARFPEFANVEDPQIAYVLETAAHWIGDQWGCDCGIALLYLAAHYLALQILSTEIIKRTSSGSGGTIISGGQVVSVTFETMKVGYSSPQFATGKMAGSEGEYPLGSTPYGQAYMDLLKVNFPAVVVV